MRNDSQPKVYLIFLSLIAVWGLSWPISKVGLQYMDPVLFTAIRFVIAVCAVFGYMIATRQLKLPARSDIPFILSIGFFQMALFVILLNLGLVYVGAGRASILVYSTPIWVTPIAVLVFKENLNLLKSVGLGLGVLGILILLSPFGFDWSNQRVLTGNVMLVGAAIAWAGVMLQTRYRQWTSTPLEMLPWQLLVGCVVTVLMAFAFQSEGQTSWNASLVLSLLYNGLGATAFGYFGSIVVTKELPSITTSIGFLGVPVVGLISSAIFLSEELTASLVLSLVIMITGLALMAKGSVIKIGDGNIARFGRE